MFAKKIRQFSLLAYQAKMLLAHQVKIKTENSSANDHSPLSQTNTQNQNTQNPPSQNPKALNPASLPTTPNDTPPSNASLPSLPNKPQKLSSSEVDFITKMVSDEMQELKEAKTIGEQADALADAVYYLYDCAGKKGIDLDAVLEIVHANNLTKVSKKVQFGKDGKVEKPTDWTDPKESIAKEIERQIQVGAF